MLGVSYTGSKMWLARKIANRLPSHRCYVEPFGGGGWLLFNKPISKVEVYNDIDGGLVNMLRVIRDEPERLKAYLENTPYSREELFTNMGSRPDDAFDRAVRHFILYEMSVNARMTAWSYSKVRSMAMAYHSKVSNIPKLSERLKFVQIDNIDFRECIEKYDAGDTLFYLDPPYEQQGTLGKVDDYYIRLPASRHTELGNVLKRIAGNFILSYSDCQVVRERYNDYTFYEFEKPITVEVQHGEERTMQVELLISSTEIHLDKPSGVSKSLEEFGVDGSMYSC